MWDPGASSDRRVVCIASVHSRIAWRNRERSGWYPRPQLEKRLPSPLDESSKPARLLAAAADPSDRPLEIGLRLSKIDVGSGLAIDGLAQPTPQHSDPRGDSSQRNRGFPTPFGHRSGTYPSLPANALTGRMECALRMPFLRLDGHAIRSSHDGCTGSVTPQCSTYVGSDLTEGLRRRAADRGAQRRALSR